MGLAPLPKDDPGQETEGPWGSRLLFAAKLDFQREERKVSSHREVALEMVWIKILGPQRTTQDCARQ